MTFPVHIESQEYRAVPRSTNKLFWDGAWLQLFVSGYRQGMALDGKKVLVLAADLFEDVELLYPLYRLKEEEVQVVLAGLDGKPVTGKKGHGPVEVDTSVEGLSASDFDALVIPGGYAPDKLPPFVSRTRPGPGFQCRR